ncbi:MULTISPECIES: hypothetical protein [Skermanella]|nr:MULTISPECIES: hypothetical protein [Skermanella]
MEDFWFGAILGLVVGYAIRALISHMRRRRFAAEYGFNPRYPSG